MNRLPSGGSTSSGFSQSPAGASSLQGQSLTSLFAKPDTQPCEVSSTRPRCVKLNYSFFLNFSCYIKL